MFNVKCSYPGWEDAEGVWPADIQAGRSILAGGDDLNNVEVGDRHVKWTAVAARYRQYDLIDIM